MYFDTLDAALVMDGHGVFVWTAYAMCALVIAVLLIAPLQRRRALLRQVARDLRRQQAHTEGTL